MKILSIMYRSLVRLFYTFTTLTISIKMAKAEGFLWTKHENQSLRLTKFKTHAHYEQLKQALRLRVIAGLMLKDSYTYY